MKKLNKKGFTLTEMIVVIAIIGILAAVLIPSVVVFVQRAQKSNDEQLAASMTNEIERYCIENNIEQEFLLGTDIRTILNARDYNMDPKYSKWTYVYDIENAKVVLLNIDEIDETEKTNLSNANPIDPTNIEESLFLLGEGKSDLEKGISKLCNVKNEDDFKEAKTLLDKTNYEGIADYFNPNQTIYINNATYFTLAANNSANVKVVYNQNTYHISNFKLNGTKLMNKYAVSQVIQTIEIDAEAQIFNSYTKSSIKKIGPGSLNGTGIIQLDVDEMVRSIFGDAVEDNNGIYFYFDENVNGSVAQVIDFNGTTVTVKYFNENGLYAYGFKAN